MLTSWLWKNLSGGSWGGLSPARAVRMNSDPHRNVCGCWLTAYFPSRFISLHQVVSATSGGRSRRDGQPVCSQGRWRPRFDPCCRNRARCGQWRTLASSPDTRVIPVPVEIRRWASRDLRNHGIDYVVVRDTDWGSEDIRGFSGT